ESVVNALERLHASVASDGLIVDTQPVGTRPAVVASGIRLGRLDCREWVGVVATIDASIHETVERGLYTFVDERQFTVKDTWDDTEECVKEVHSWRGTRISDALVRRIARSQPPISIDQLVRLRLLRSTRASALTQPQGQ